MLTALEALPLLINPDNSHVRVTRTPTSDFCTLTYAVSCPEQSPRPGTATWDSFVEGLEGRSYLGGKRWHFKTQGHMSPGIERPHDMEFLCVVVLGEAKADKGDPAGCSAETVTLALSC